MSTNSKSRLSTGQQILLVSLRILLGWHFLYEGYYKLMVPAWSADGSPLPAWTSAGYIRAASGPVARIFQRMLDAGWTPWIDNAVKAGLIAVGLSLMLGLFSRIGCWGALFLLAMFYLPMIPFAGVQQPGSEGAYLIVNKTLIEAAAVCVLLAFDTGSIAGLDRLIATARLRRRTEPAEQRSPAAADVA